MELTMCWYTCTVYEGLGGDYPPVSSQTQTVGGPLLTPASASRPCHPTQLQHSTVTHLTPRLTACLHHRYSPPWADVMWNLQCLHWVSTDQNKLTDKGDGSPNWIPSPGCFFFRPIGELADLMCDVSLDCSAIGGLPFPYTSYASCLTFLAVPHSLWHLRPRISLHAQTSHCHSRVQCTAKKNTTNWETGEFPPTDVLRKTYVSSLSHPAIIPGCQSSHWCCKIEMTVNCLGLWLTVKGVSVSCCWLSSCSAGWVTAAEDGLEGEPVQDQLFFWR